MEIFRNQPALDDWLAPRRAARERVALVPTMGSLHEGHGSLVRLAREHADCVLATVFVNPAQFGPEEDFERYPRDLEADFAKLARWGADAVFAPAALALYPHGLDGVRIEPAPALVRRLCGPRRPGHFAGVLTVVLKLFHLTKPDVAVFGQKDYQQFRVIADMVEDLCLDVVLVRAPIVRAADGVALASRNAYLGPDDRPAARALSRTLAAILAQYRRGEHGSAQLATLGHDVWRQIGRELARPGELEYLEVLDGRTLGPAEPLEGEGVAAIAAHVGNARLIDNVVLAPTSPDLPLLALLPAPPDASSLPDPT